MIDPIKLQTVPEYEPFQKSVSSMLLIECRFGRNFTQGQSNTVDKHTFPGG